MNGNYYQNPTFPTAVNPNNNFEDGYIAGQQSNVDSEQSYIENILRLNKGKKIKG